MRVCVCVSAYACVCARVNLFSRRSIINLPRMTPSKASTYTNERSRTLRNRVRASVLPMRSRYSARTLHNRYPRAIVVDSRARHSDRIRRDSIAMLQWCDCPARFFFSPARSLAGRFARAGGDVMRMKIYNRDERANVIISLRMNLPITYHI